MNLHSLASRTIIFKDYFTFQKYLHIKIQPNFVHKLRRLNVEQSFKFDRREVQKLIYFETKKKKKKFDNVNLSRIFGWRDAFAITP